MMLMSSQCGFDPARKRDCGRIEIFLAAHNQGFSLEGFVEFQK
jgi:hypothetical protein